MGKGGLLLRRLHEPNGRELIQIKYKQVSFPNLDSLYIFFIWFSHYFPLEPLYVSFTLNDLAPLFLLLLLLFPQMSWVCFRLLFFFLFYFFFFILLIFLPLSRTPFPYLCMSVQLLPGFQDSSEMLPPSWGPPILWQLELGVALLPKE